MIDAILVAAMTALALLERELMFAAALAIGGGLLAMAKWHQQPGWKTLLMRAIESTSAGLCVFDADSRVILSNQQFARMYGLSKGDLTPGVAVKDNLARRSSAFAAARRLEYIADFDHGGSSASSTEYVCPRAL